MHRRLKAYAALFGHRELVADMLRGLVPNGCLTEQEYASLEHVRTLSSDDDVSYRALWRFRIDNTWVYLLLLIQAHIDRGQSLRIAEDAVKVWLKLLQEEPYRSHREPLPPICPVVVYIGEDPWNAPRTLKELIRPLPRCLWSVMFTLRH